MPGRAATLALARRAWYSTGLKRLADAVTARLPPRLRTAIERRRLELRVRAGLRLVPEPELTETFRGALELLRRDGRGDVGDYLEFGVYIGTSLLCMQRASEQAGLRELRLYGFDSFEGLPAAGDPELDGVWAPGDFRSDLEFTRRHLDENGVDWGRVTLVPGWFEETLTAETRHRLGLRRAGVVMFDCDIYSSTRAALAFVEPLLADEAVLVFDDWHSGGLASRRQGERRAFDEFVAEHPDLVVEQTLPTYSENAVVLHVRRRRVTGSGSDPSVS